jgi:hypothetical protein
MLDRSAVALLPSSQRFDATGLDALLSQTAKIDTSPFILSPFEAERTSADRAFTRLHVIPVFTALCRGKSTRQAGATSRG